MYRLNQTGTDGNHRLSEVRSIVFDTANKIKVYPNPATDQLNIVADISGSIQQIKLLDVRGREVHNSTENTSTISMHAFAQGVYLIQVTLKDGNISSVKVEKQ